MNILRKLRTFFRKEKFDTDMSEELRMHLELQAAENQKRGMSVEDARYAAQRQFGGVEQVKERARDLRGWVWWDQFCQDLRYAARSLRRAPGFTFTAVLTLALGIGVNAALFTTYNAVALRPLPVREPDGLVKVMGFDTARRSGVYPNFSYAEYLDYRNGNRVFSGLAAYNETYQRTNDTGPAASDPAFTTRGPGLVPVQVVSENYFKVLGADIKLGRAFLPEDDQEGAPPVVVISHLFWERRMQSDPRVLGKSITLGAHAFTVVGVAAPEFAGHQPAPPAGWIPAQPWLSADGRVNRNVTPFRLLGRLLPAMTTQQAKADLDVIAAQLARQYPSDMAKLSVRLERGMKFVNIPLTAASLAALTPLLLAFGLVLLIACTNVANLLLVRGVTRQREIGVRLTLGASRGRIVRQLLTENLLLCLLAAVVGLILAAWTLQAIQPLVMSNLPTDWAPEARRWKFLNVLPDSRVLIFTGALALVAALATGLLPALQAVRGNLISAVKNDGTAVGRWISQSRMRSFLVVAQVAVSLTLLSCAGLLTRNFLKLRKFDVGFDPRAIVAADVVSMLPAAERRVPAVVFRRQAVETLRSMPGIESAAQAFRAPMLGGSGTTALVKLPGGAQTHELRYCLVSGGIFETFGIPIRRGRAFTAAEIDAGARLLVVSETVARRLWPNDDAIGKVLAISESAFATSARPVSAGTFRECEVIGVAKNVSGGVDDTEFVRLYLPLWPDLTMSNGVFVRPRDQSAAALAEITKRAAVAGIKLDFNRPLSANLEEETLPFFGLAVLSGALGALALVMATVGIYGVMAFSVTQRVREIGIRIALGARPQNVVRLILRQGLRLVAAGVVVGLVGGALFALLLGKILYGLSGAFDPLVFAMVTLLLGAIALMACWLPARRATRVNPMEALRAE